MSSDESYPIGIDLGTTYSCVGVWRGERVEIITNEQGNRTTPSCVAFTPYEKFVGEVAQNQASQNVTNTVFGAKRMIGRRFDEPQIQSDMRHWPFKVKNKDGGLAVEVEYQNKIQEFTPTEISAMVLIKMKQVAEARLGPVKDAVITVPAYFDNGQRQATRDAGSMAGLNVLRILSEPTAAALAHKIRRGIEEKKTILVYDLGGGTFDCTILTLNERGFVVNATAGDTHLGGEDFDNRMVDHFVAELKVRWKKDISKDLKAMRRLRTACERVKRSLSSSTQCAMEVDALVGGFDFKSSLTRAKFNELCADLFQSTLTTINKIITERKLEKSKVAEILLSGGSSRIPMVQKLISDYFDGKKLNASVNLDEAVAMGAAIQASFMKGNASRRLKDILLIEVTPISLGIETDLGQMSVIVDKNSPIPKAVEKVFTTFEDYQTAVDFSVYGGESCTTKENLLLGKFSLEGIPPNLRGVPKFLVTFTIDLNGILNVSAKDQSSGASKSLVIQNYRGRLNKSQIDGFANRSSSFAL